MNIDPAVQKLESGVQQAKVAVQKAKLAADKYKISQKHWQAADRAEAGVHNAVSMIDKLFPNRSRGKAAIWSNQMTILAIGAFIFLIGSTFSLWWFTKEQEESDEYGPE